MKIVFWLPFMDSNYYYTWLHVQSLNKEKPLFVLNKAQSLFRKEQGWNPQSLDEFDVIMLKKDGWDWKNLQIIRENRDAVHIFFGFRGQSFYLGLILYALLHGVKVAIFSEAYSSSPVGYNSEESFGKAFFKVLFRPTLYRFYALSIKLGSHKRVSPCLLPISMINRDQLIRAGFDKTWLYPFGYFVPDQKIKSSNKKQQDSSIHLIFVGSLLARKGLDIAIKAVECVNQRRIQIVLDIYGSGEPEQYISCHSEFIRYKGVLGPEEVQAKISSYDALILPSRHDGWGVVVNEALLQGIPAIVSDNVGAKCILEATGAGLIFRSEDVNDLAAKLEQLTLNPFLLNHMRKQASLVGAQISPEIAAQYILDVLDYYFFKGQTGQRPEAIWC